MKTASFFTYKGPGRVSIARFAPRGTPKGFRIYKKLAPGPWFNSVSREEYEKRFAAQLAELDPPQVVAELENLSGEAEPVLLCYESPPFTETNWCHRRLVARWLLETMGMHVRELIAREKLEDAVFEHTPAERTRVLEDGSRAVLLNGKRKLAPLSGLTEKELVARLPRDLASSLGLA